MKKTSIQRKKNLNSNYFIQYREKALSVAPRRHEEGLKTLKAVGCKEFEYASVNIEHLIRLDKFWSHILGNHA